ncbi:MAG TPA: hydroxyacid dehydrogenase [Eoetvoesiella sp.]
MKTKIVISEFMDEAAVDMLRDHFELVYDPALLGKREELLSLVASASALIVRNQTRVDQTLLAQAPVLKVVGRLGVGLDNIDVPACADQGIEVIPATGANSLAVAEYVIAASMMLLRGSFTSSDSVLAGKWPRARLSVGRETAGKLIGVVGFGGIGQLVASMARLMGMRVLAYDPNVPDQAPLWAETGVQPMSLQALVAQADVISLHVPLMNNTRNLFDEALIRQMKPGAVLINTARGGIVSESALVAALREGRLGAAALDVFTDEPVRTNSLLVDTPNLMLTPHIAGVTQESNVRVSALVAKRVADSLLKTHHSG